MYTRLYNLSRNIFISNHSKITLQKYQPTGIKKSYVCGFFPKISTLPPSLLPHIRRDSQVYNELRRGRGRGWTVCADGLRYRRSFNRSFRRNPRYRNERRHTGEEAELTHEGAYKSDLNKLYERAPSFTRSILRTKRGRPLVPALKQRGERKGKFCVECRSVFYHRNRI